VPVTRDGRVVYGLSAVILPQAISRIIKTNGLPPTWVAWITDGKKRLVASTLEKAALVAGPSSAFVRTTGADMTLSVGSLADGSDVRFSSDLVDGSDWQVHIGMPMSEYRRISTRGLLFVLAAGGLALLLAITAIVLFLRELKARQQSDAALASWQRMDALGKLAGGVAHDFNNLLMVFQSAAEAIKRKHDDERRMKQIAEGMTEAVGRGKTLSQRLLSFSRRSNQDAQLFRLQQNAPALQDMLAQATQDAVQVNLDLKADLWPVAVDPRALETALINLVTNAREAMPTGGVVDVKARNVPEMFNETRTLKGAGLAISVSDTGAGIKPEDLQRVFEPFYTTKAGSSHGLGLSQVFAFAERSAGMVKVSSVRDRGSVFTIYLPRAIEPAPPETTDGIWTLPRKVLVVDDTPSSLAVARTMLEDNEFIVSAAPSGRTALAVLRSEPDIEALLTDVRMPEMSGLELAGPAKREFPHLAIVLMTGYSEVIESGTTLDWPVVTKPFTSEQLRAALARPADRAKPAPRA
jgi:signal transduction histidine kinase